MKYIDEYINAKWHYPKMGEYPVKYGKYTQQNYPQIPCLVLYNGMYGIRFWNCTEECWDDEDCDDFFCEKEAVEKWLYIDVLESFQQEQPSLPDNLDEAAKEYSESVSDGHNYRDLTCGFKAGVEWAFKQGWTFDTHKGTFGICFDGNIDNLLDSLKDKEEVTVQIRKKEG